LLIGTEAIFPVGNGPDHRAFAGGPWLPHGSLGDRGGRIVLRGRQEALGGRQAPQGDQVPPPSPAEPLQGDHEPAW
jgi:hypothetical protein